MPGPAPDPNALRRFRPDGGPPGSSGEFVTCPTPPSPSSSPPGRPQFAAATADSKIKNSFRLFIHNAHIYVLPARLLVAVNGDQIFPAMLSAIRSAKRSITFETYVFWDGEIGRQFTEALAERARAGVKVHAILDAHGEPLATVARGERRADAVLE